ncbi:MAG: helix-turn-helix transcriptional regulator [Clostridiales bacterium]|nr:helix-turn-helix transcriptional regulator [Clostridiales bacterium]
MDLKQTIADNIAFYRKEIGLKQSELAEKLNYSDKAISKWERGESYPDIATLVELAKLFNVTVDQLITNKKKVKKVKPLVALLSSGIVWLIATAAYVILNMILPGLNKSWLAFVYAVPVTTIVLLVFFAIWGLNFAVLIDESVMIWTIALCIFLTLSIQGAFYIFFLPIPLQILAILWYELRVKRKAKIKFKRSRIKSNTTNDDTPN